MPIKLIRYYVSNIPNKKLHIGCGSVRLQGWINVDIHPAAPLILDIKHKLPIRSDSIQLIHTEHVIEHLTLQEALGFFSEAKRILKKGGTIRIAMPDLDDIVNAYIDDWKKLDWVHWQGHQFIGSNAEMMNIAFRWWGHKYLYNKHELERRLRQAGFTEISFCDHGSSSLEEFCSLETRVDSTLIAEATK